MFAPHGNLFNKKRTAQPTTTFSSSSSVFSSFFPLQKLAQCDGAYIRKGGTNNQENKNGKK
jgi:hypothetical protein